MVRDSQNTPVVNSGRAARSPHQDPDHASCAVSGRATAERSLRSGATALFLLAIVLLGVGISSFFYVALHDQKGGLLIVDAAVKSFGDAPSGQRIPVTFSLANQSGQPIRILGAAPVCSVHGCVYIENLPLDIPRLSRRNLLTVVETTAPGQFAGEFTVFSDAPGQPTIVLTVNGRVIEE